MFNRHLHIVPAVPEGGNPVEFYRTIIHDPRGLPWSKGVVLKYRDSADQLFKVKANDALDIKVTRCIEGAGKFAGRLEAMVVEGPTGVESAMGCPSCAEEGHDRSGDNLSISIQDPRKYICWASCTRDMIRAAMGCLRSGTDAAQKPNHG